MLSVSLRIGSRSRRSEVDLRASSHEGIRLGSALTANRQIDVCPEYTTLDSIATNISKEGSQILWLYSLKVHVVLTYLTSAFLIPEVGNLV